MRKRSVSSAAIALTILSAASPSFGAERVARMIDATGGDLGTVELREVPHGVLLHVQMKGLPPGPHAIHLHSIGKCEPPFDSAGPHYNPGGTAHGLLSVGGGHGGDLPNLHVPQSGAVDVEMLAPGIGLTAATQVGSDSKSIVVHAGPDDYMTDPAGNSGARIACGVVAP
jgi:Cu-Zn family superoxide dismutase